MEKATFAAGCFWGAEAEFKELHGVSSTKVGFMGGNLPNPTYEDVCTGKTGHAEVVQLEYDPKKIAYEELLRVFWEIHNPTTLNRQGLDIGTQYRSVIFYHNQGQKRLAEKSKKDLLKKGIKAVTKVEPASDFYMAEEYHQNYIEKHGLFTC